VSKKCPTCGKGKLRKGVTEQTVTVSGTSFTGPVPAEVCSECDEALVTAADLERFELSVAAEIARLGLRSGDGFRFMRKALGLSGVATAELLDVSAETVSRWEHGKPEARTFALLGSVVSDRLAGRDETVQRLQALQSAQRKPTKVRVDAA
jgi:putative zinc finger/helix-turn-helix YgiT family protein